MIERFFFDWVDVSGYDFPINKGIEFAFSVFPHSAHAEFRWCNLAAVAAEKTGDFPAFEALIKHGFFNHFAPHCSPLPRGERGVIFCIN
jgi:hypothetical protein